MIIEKYTLKNYIDEKGKEPFEDWLYSLQKTDRARVRTRLDRVAVGNLGDFDHVGDRVYELRFKNRSGFRVYFGFDGNEVILLVNGGDKDTQERDIAKAKYYWNDWNKRKVGV